MRSAVRRAAAAVGLLTRLASLGTATAQRPERAPRVGYLSWGSHSDEGRRRRFEVFFTNQRRQIAKLAAEKRVPAVYGHIEHADAGGLIAYRANLFDLERRAAMFVDKILKGGKPGELPVEHPTKLELVINLRAAKAIGLTMPPSLLRRADRIID